VIDALIQGRLHGKPVSRVSKSGNPYVTAKLRTSTREGETVWANVIAFDKAAVAALLALGDGDPVSMVGEATPKVYIPPDGPPRPSLDLVAHGVQSPYSVTRKRRATQTNLAFPFDDDLEGVA